MFRTRSARKKYIDYIQQNKECPFCMPLLAERNIVQKTKNFFVTTNDFAYNYWEGYEVAEHLMVVPYEHQSNLSGLSDQQKIELIYLLAKYEKSGFNIYARSTDNKLKTVPSHQHSHLIKTSGKPAKFILFLKKPYQLIKF